jgi:hypothetical protein
VFWKDSLDFNRIIKKQSDVTETKNMSPDRVRAKQAADKAIASINRGRHQGNGDNLGVPSRQY